jgi:hypothetical protein
MIWLDIFLTTLVQTLASLTALAGFGLIVAFALSRIGVSRRRPPRRPRDRDDDPDQPSQEDRSW